MKVFLESLPLEYINYNMLIHISFHHINISVTWSLCPANQARERVVNGEDDEEDGAPALAAVVEEDEAAEVHFAVIGSAAAPFGAHQKMGVCITCCNLTV